MELHENIFCTNQLPWNDILGNQSLLLGIDLKDQLQKNTIIKLITDCYPGIRFLPFSEYMIKSYSSFYISIQSLADSNKNIGKSDQQENEIIWIDNNFKFWLNKLSNEIILKLCENIISHNFKDVFALALIRVWLKMSLKCIVNEKNISNPNSVIIRKQESIELIPIDDISYFQAFGKYSIVFTITGSKHMYTKSLLEIENTNSNYHLIRCHKSILVQKDQIKEITNFNTVVLRNGNIVPLARRRRKEVIRSLVKNLPKM
jgi:hypothetical protein